MECVQVDNEESTAVGSSNLDILKKYHKEAFKFINEGLNLEDRGKSKEAGLCYKKGLRSAEGGLKLPGGASDLNSKQANEYNDILSKLSRAQKQVALRLEALGVSDVPQAAIVNNTPQTAHVDNIQTTTNNSQTKVIKPSAPPLQDHLDLKEAKSEADSSENNKALNLNDTWQDVKELLSIEKGVRLFHLDGKGDVSTWTSPCVMQVFQILKENLDKVSPPAFMKCGEWVYPMEPGQSPVLKSQHRTYMFPDISIEQETSGSTQIPCVGIVLADFVPDAVVSRFERILSCYCDFRNEVEKQIKEKPKRPPPPAVKKPVSAGEESANAPLSNGTVVESDVIIAEPGIADETSVSNIGWSDKISAGISVGSQWISWGLIKGAQYTGVLVEKGANSLRQRLKPNEEATTVDPEISHNIRQLHQATGSVVQVSAFLVSALGTLTVNLGRKLAPHVTYHGQKLLPEKYKLENNESSQKTLEEAKKVAAAGLQGFGLMFLALEQAGKDLYQSITTAAVQTVQHKYGDEVGDVTEDTMGAAGNAVQAFWNVKELGPKAIAKRALKDTGKAMVLPPNEAIQQ